MDIFDKGAPTIKWRKESLEHTHLGKASSNMQKNENELLHLTTQKVNSKRIKDFDVRPETIKCLEENHF